MVSIEIDELGRITALCPDDLSAEGWVRVAVERVTDHTGKSLDELFAGLQDERGVCLYKWVAGFAEPRTVAEMAADTPEPEPRRPTEMEALQEKLEMRDMVIEEILFTIIPEMLGGGL